MLTLITAALQAARPGIRCRTAENPADALRTALDLADGGPVLFVYEKLALANDALVAVGAEPWPEQPSPAERGSVTGSQRPNTIRPGTGPTIPADAAEAAVATATAVVAGAADAAESAKAAEAAVADAAVADAAAVVANAAAAAITDAADAALVRPRQPMPAGPAVAVPGRADRDASDASADYRR